jgi:hypothetical protein
MGEESLKEAERCCQGNPALVTMGLNLVEWVGVDIPQPWEVVGEGEVQEIGPPGVLKFPRQCKPASLGAHQWTLMDSVRAWQTEHLLL